MEVLPPHEKERTRAVGHRHRAPRINVATYQDIVLAGEPLVAGRRDCADRWSAIAPHALDAKTVLDVGSNFGWFGLKLCEESPDRVVASVEADRRSATIQRAVLASHRSHRVCLLTDLADRRMLDHFASAGQRFDLALCLSVLHWMRDHASFLTRLAELADRIIIEYPDPREPEVGIAAVRREIGLIGDYLAALLPSHRRTLIARSPSHLAPEHSREMWLVSAPARDETSRSAGFDAGTLVEMGLSWPPRTWWRDQLRRIDDRPTVDQPSSRVMFTAEGLTRDADEQGRVAGKRLRVGQLPERALLSSRQWLTRLAKRARGKLGRMTAR